MEKENRQIKKSEKLLMQLIVVRIKRLTLTERNIFWGKFESKSGEFDCVFKWAAIFI